MPAEHADTAPAMALPGLDLSRWAVVAYNDDTGLGRMAQDIKSLLGVRHLVVASDRLETKPLVDGRDTLLPLDAPADELAALLAGLRGIIILERWWNPRLLAVAKRMGVRVACVPMWEWFRGTDAEWAMVDAFLCPSSICLKIVRQYGWKKAVHLPWALDLARLPAREIRGPGRTFFHNAGLVDHDDRKGTRFAVAAFRALRSADVRLIVRLQRPADVGPVDDRCEVRTGNLPSVAALYAEGDVAVQPSTMEGLGFMVLEPVCCGIPTITLDHPPMADHVSQHELRVRKRWVREPSFARRAARVRHAYRRLPSISDLTRKMQWCVDHDLTAVSRSNRRFAEELYDPERLRSAWRRTLRELG